MKLELCFRRWLWPCLKWGHAEKALELEEKLFQSLGRVNKDLSQGDEYGKYTRAIAEGPVEIWRQILEPRMVFFRYRRK